MAFKVVSLVSLRASRWREAALATLMFSLCAAAQQNPSPAPGAGSGANAPVSAEQTLTRVRELRAAGQIAASLAPLERYLASDPRNTVVRLEYARALAVLRRFPEAAGEYRRVLETEPQNASAMVGMAKVAAWQGQNQLALETYERVLARRPGFYDAVVGKAFVLLWMGRQEEARSLFLEAQRQHPNDREVREALASSGAPIEESAAPAAARAESAGEAGKPAGADAKKPAASDASGSAPAKTQEPAAPPAAMTAPAATTLPPTAELEPAIPGNEPPTQGSLLPVPQPLQGSAAPLRAREAHKGTAAATAMVRQDPVPVSSAAPLPMRISSEIPVQLAMLGMFATVVGAIAYRTYRVRRHATPLATRRVLELPPSSLASPTRAAATGQGSPLAGRVLLVHPHEAVRDFAHRVLAGAGAEVLALGRGEDAVAGLGNFPYDAIVVSDQLAEGWSGREIYRWLERNQPGAERRFVLVLTGEADAEVQAFLEESRALAMVAPFGVSDLLAMTRLAMGRSRAQA
jgi:tetratricopeptide (TPR) repeat protein